MGHMSRNIHFFLPSLPKRIKDRQRETPQADMLFNIKPLDGETDILFFNHMKIIDETIVLSNARRGFR